MEESPDNNGNGSSSKWIWIGIVAFVVVILVASGLAVMRLVMTDDGENRKKLAQAVTLLREPPPPPPKVEKPPEPEIKQKEEVIQPEQKQQVDEPKDDKPVGKNLGVDAEGGAGSDGFGLVGNKGGKALVGGGGSGELMRQYGGYVKLVQDDLRKKVQQVMQQNGGIPKAKLQTTIKIQLDQRGTVVSFKILAPSGDPGMDHAVKEALSMATISQPPPEGMPKGMSIRISSQG